jgi:hypothetical protein
MQVLKNALTEAFLVTETEFNAWARLNRDTSGACSLVAMVSAGDIVCLARTHGGSASAYAP